jgi:hypothetical protein
VGPSEDGGAVDPVGVHEKAEDQQLLVAPQRWRAQHGQRPARPLGQRGLLVDGGEQLDEFWVEEPRGPARRRGLLEQRPPRPASHRAAP